MPYIIPAIIRHNLTAATYDFDAFGWFETATDQQIAEVASAQFCGLETNVIAKHVLILKECPNLQALGEYALATKDDLFTTRIDRTAAERYLAGRRMLDWLTQTAYGYTSKTAAEQRYRGVVFTEGGLARFFHIAGWILGIASVDRKLALTLAREFDDAFKNLTTVDTDFGVRDDPNSKVRVPHRKTVVSDDGTFGGFSCGWYHPVRDGRVLEVAKDLDPEAAEGGSDVASHRWPSALWSAREKLNIRKDLDEHRHFWPTWDVVTEEVIEVPAKGEDEAYSYPHTKHSAGFMSSVIVEYAFAYNGAMLYRGPGAGQVFSVSLDTSGRLWTVHT